MIKTILHLKNGLVVGKIKTMFFVLCKDLDHPDDLLAAILFSYCCNETIEKTKESIALSYKKA